MGGDEACLKNATCVSDLNIKDFQRNARNSVLLKFKISGETGGETGVVYSGFLVKKLTYTVP